MDDSHNHCRHNLRIEDLLTVGATHSPFFFVLLRLCAADAAIAVLLIKMKEMHPCIGQKEQRLWSLKLPSQLFQGKIFSEFHDIFQQIIVLPVQGKKVGK